MKYIIAFLSLSFFSLTSPKTLYNSLNPNSISEHLAFYELFPNTPEGERAIQHINSLFRQKMEASVPFENLKDALNALISLGNKPGKDMLPSLSDKELDFFAKLGARLPNRRLKGAHVLTEEEVLTLKEDEIDLARALFLSENETCDLRRLKSYEAYLDLMAFEILAKLTPNPGVREKVDAMNHYIFFELGFRFPPHSLYAKDIDLYTFLPSVLDSRKGVCLGVSILYIALAQRLDLQLEMVTPPGHIYIRAKEGDEIINIETTMRGVNPDSSVYLGVDTRSLPIRKVREVIGMAHFNRASAYWQDGKPEKALASYAKAYPYMKDDPLLIELMGYTSLMSGDIEKGRELLEKIQDTIPDHVVSKNSVPKDFLSGKVDVDGLKAVFTPVDEKRSSILKKKEEVEGVLKKFPEFKAGWFQLGTAYLQLHRTKEALEALKKVHELDNEDATTEYYLSLLYAERLDYIKAWQHLKQAEKLTAKRNHYPKVLKELRKELRLIYPE